MDNDNKALDLNYNSKINLLGKERELGRTKMKTVRQIGALYDNARNLMAVSDDESFDKLHTELLTDAQSLLIGLIKPLTKKDIEEMDVEDFGDVWRAVDSRDQRRQGKSDAEIIEGRELRRRAELTVQRKMAEGDLDFLEKYAAAMKKMNSE